MGFRINTNISAMSAHANATMNNRAIDSSLNKLNSGFRINTAADDASGMAIADSLRSQANSLGQAIMNANDAIGIIQTADKAMDEQIKILDTIKTKAIQSAQDGQTTETRRSLQADISRLMEELDNIGNTTSFNGQKLLSGTFSNKEFQIGAYSNETVKASIGATTSDKIGLTRFETGHNVRQNDVKDLGANGTITMTFKNVDGINDVTIEPVRIADQNGGKSEIKQGQGLGALAEAINKASDKTGIKANVTVQSVFKDTIKAGTTTDDFTINGVKIGSVEVKDKDGNGALRAAINSVKDQTGVEASVDSKGRLVLNNRDGRGIQVSDGALPAPEDAGKTMAEKLQGVTATTAPTIAKNTDATFSDIQTATSTNKAVAIASDKVKLTDLLTKDNNSEVTSNQVIAEIEKTNAKDAMSAKGEANMLALLKASDAVDEKGTIKANSLSTLAFAGLDTYFAAASDGTAVDTTSEGEVKTAFDAVKSSTNLDELKTNLTTLKEKINADKSADGTVKNTTDDTAAAIKKDVGIYAASNEIDGMIKAVDAVKAKTGGGGMANIVGLSTENATNFGRLSLVSSNGKDIQVEVKGGADGTQDMTSAIGFDKNVSEKTVSLRETNAKIDKDVADAMGFNQEDWMMNDGDNQNGYAAGVMTAKGAQAMIDIAETAQKALEAIRSDLGSVQNQLVSTVNNISVTQVNVKSAESNIRDVDFASESANFSKHQILAQSGVYAMSQANAVQQNVMRLLQ